MKIRTRLLTGCLTAILACSAWTAASPTPTPHLKLAHLLYVHVKNESDRCAWFTLYTATILTPWSIVEGSSRPRFIPARESFEFSDMITVPLPIENAVEAKVLAEIKSGPGCAGHDIGKLTVIDKSIVPDKKGGIGIAVETTLAGSNGSYRLSPIQPAWTPRPRPRN